MGYSIKTKIILKFVIYNNIKFLCAINRIIYPTKCNFYKARNYTRHNHQTRKVQNMLYNKKNPTGVSRILVDK